MAHSKQIPLTLLAGFLTASITLLPLFPSFSWVVVFSFFETLPLFLLGLSVGLWPLYGATALAAFIIFLGAGPLAGGQFLLVSLLGPVFLVNRALLHRTRSTGEITWYPASALLRMLILAMSVVMFIGFGVYFYATQGEDPQLYVQQLFAGSGPQGRIQDIEFVFSKVFPILPGIFSLSWGLTVFINAVIAQGLLTRFKRNLRPSPSLEVLHLPKGFTIAFFVFVLLSFIGVGYIETFGKNAACALGLPFFLIGLGLVHRWIHKTSYTTIAFTLFYLLLLFFWPALIVVAVGILKPWIEKAS